MREERNSKESATVVVMAWSTKKKKKKERRKEGRKGGKSKVLTEGAVLTKGREEREIPFPGACMRPMVAAFCCCW